MDGTAGAAVAGSSKLTWNHNPANGRYYFATITNMVFPNGSAPWGYFTMMRFPFDVVTNTWREELRTGTTTQTLVGVREESRIGTIIDPCGTTGAATGYSGIATAKYGHNSSIVPDGSLEFDTVIITATGLLPSTRHELYVNGVKNTTAVRPFGGRVGDPLTSDSFGRIKLEYLLPLTNWADRTAELGLSKTPSTSNGLNPSSSSSLCLSRILSISDRRLFLWSLI